MINNTQPQTEKKKLKKKKTQEEKRDQSVEESNQDQDEAKDNNNGEQLVASTTLKTVRNIKNRKSFGLFEKENKDDRPQSNQKAKKTILNRTGMKPRDSQNSDSNQQYFSGENNNNQQDLDERVSTSDAQKRQLSQHQPNQIQFGQGGGEESTLETHLSPKLQINNLYGNDADSGKKQPNKQGRTKIYGKAVVQPENDLLASRMEYFNIDMQMAIEFVLSKSKQLKDKIEIEQLSDQFIMECITRNKVFIIAYNSFLQNLIHQKLINHEFKNVQQKTFAKLEKFFIDKIHQFQQKQQLHHSYLVKSKGIWDQFNKRIKQIKEQIEIERQEVWNI